HGVAVAGNEEARALPHRELMAPLTARRIRIFLAETLEEELERRAFRNRQLVFVQSGDVSTRVELDANGDDRRLHLLDDVRKTHGPRQALRVSRRYERRERCLRPGRAIEKHAACERGDGCEKNKTTRGKQSARFHYSWKPSGHDEISEKGVVGRYSGQSMV